MGAPDILGRLTATGIRVEANGDRLRVWPSDRLTDELRSLIRRQKPALLAFFHGEAAQLLSPEERAALDRLATAWGMDSDDKAIMLRQCQRGGELPDGSRISAESALRFWLAEAGVVH